MNSDAEAIRGQLDALINFYDERNLQSDNLCFKKTFNMLDRSKREFDANLFFILMFGPLKAGKSTLTNLLARDYVSPTGFGIETTLRPSIIKKSPTEEYSIDVYEIVDAKDDKEELFDLVMDVLRGILNIQVIKSRVRKVTYPLTRQNVEKQLIRYLDIEPLVTVLNVPGGDLVTKHIALIDMPGLDGIKSNWQDSVVHKWILKRADFLIFIQSSMAALNKATFEFLQDAYLGSKKPPLWLVQNIIDAKYWRSDEDRRSDNEGQRRNAKEHISSLLGISEDLPSTAINLGKASDGMEKDNFRNLLEESGFPEFEKKLRDILNERRVKIQEENSIKGVLKAIQDCKQEFEAYRAELKGKLAEYEEQRGELRKPAEILNNMRKMAKVEAVKGALRNTLEGQVDAWKAKCCGNFLKKENMFPGNVADITKEKLESKVMKAVDAVNQSRKEDFLENSGDYRRKLNDLAKQYIKDYQGDNFTRLNETLEELGLKPYKKESDFASSSEWPSFSISDEITKARKKVTEPFGGKKRESKINALCQMLNEEYGEYVEAQQKSMIENLYGEFNDWISKLYDDLEAHLNEQTESREQKIVQEQVKIEDTLANIVELECKYGELEQFITGEE